MKINCQDNAYHCYLLGGMGGGPDCVDFMYGVRICYTAKINYDTIEPDSIIFTNFGLHYTDPYDSIYIQAIHTLIENAQKYKKLKNVQIVWRQVSLQHFDSVDCSYENIAALNNVKKICSNRVCDYTHSNRAKRDQKGLQLLQDSGVVDILHIQGYEKTSGSNVKYQSRTDTNVGDEDCTHFCIPGLPDHWNRLMYNYLISL